jgi:hypothetical protein
VAHEWRIEWTVWICGDSEACAALEAETNLDSDGGMLEFAQPIEIT